MDIGNIPFIRPTFRALSHLFPAGISTVNYEGFRMDIDRRAYPEMLLLPGRGQLPFVMRTFKSLLKPESYVIDIGAAMGCYTLVAARVAKWVFAFEPYKPSFELLTKNVERAQLYNVVLYNKAVTARADTVDLYLSSNPLHNSLGKGRTSSKHTTVVETTSLDSQFGHVTIDVVKINAEGSEPLILRGMQETVRRNPQLSLIIEYDPTALKGINTANEVVFIGRLNELFDVRRDVMIISTRKEQLIPFKSIQQLDSELTHPGGTAYLLCRRNIRETLC